MSLLAVLRSTNITLEFSGKMLSDRIWQERDGSLNRGKEGEFNGVTIYEGVGRVKGN